MTESETKHDPYEDILAGTVGLGYLDCTLLEYAHGIKYYIDQEARKPNGDTHLVKMLCRAACVGWENIRLFKAPVNRSGEEVNRVHELEAALQEIIDLPAHPMRKKAVVIAQAALNPKQPEKETR